MNTLQELLKKKQSKIASAIKETSKQTSYKDRLALKRQQALATPRDIPSEGTTTKSIPNGRLQNNTLNKLSESLKNKLKPYEKKETFSLDIQLNAKQQSAVDLAKSGKNFVLIGEAGTGKTSTERALCHVFLDSDRISTSSFKVSGQDRIEAPSIAIVAATRRAAANSARAILKDEELKMLLPNNIMTMHALLEYIPVTFTEEGSDKELFRFLPQRNAKNPLDLTHIIIEEGTLVGLDLWNCFFEAMPEDIQIIIVGDINQLPPVFGASILNYGISKLPVIELTQGYRQEADSPVLNNAHNILSGKSIEPAVSQNGLLQIISGKNKVQAGQLRMSLAISALFNNLHKDGKYNPNEDIILTPYNKQLLGTTNMNMAIAQEVTPKGTMVHEVLVGFTKTYLAEGDKVMYNKMDAIITNIKHNPAYIGISPKIASPFLTRNGFYAKGASEDLANKMDEAGTADYSNFSVDAILEQDQAKKMQASHSVTITYELGNSITLSAVGDLAFPVFQLGYVLTCHKAQGSEWDRVFIILHSDQLRNLSREWLYTAVTRAKSEVYIIAKEPLLDKIIEMQKVKGQTLQDKVEIFNADINFDKDITFTKGVV